MTDLRTAACQAAALLRDELAIEIECTAIFRPDTRTGVPVSIDHDDALFARELAAAIRAVEAHTGVQPGRTWPDWLNEMVAGTSALLKTKTEAPQ